MDLHLRFSLGASVVLTAVVRHLNFDGAVATLDGLVEAAGRKKRADSTPPTGRRFDVWREGKSCLRRSVPERPHDRQLDGADGQAASSPLTPDA